MYSTRLHRATTWLALACYLTGATAAGLFHHHHDLEPCSGGVCVHTAIVDEKCGHDHGHSHAHQHTHSHAGHCSHHHPAKIVHAGQSFMLAPSSGCHSDCVACQLLSQKAVRAQLAQLEFRGEQVITVSCEPVSALGHLIADEHPARGPPAAA